MNDGWGLATDGKVLFGSDGSSTLYQMIQTDPQTFKGLPIACQWSSIPFLSPFFPKLFWVQFSNLTILCLVNVYALHFSGIYIALFSVAVSKQVVYYKGHEVHNLNELEYINGEVWANVLPVCLCVITD